jgi:hypothetical protein
VASDFTTSPLWGQTFPLLGLTFPLTEEIGVRLRLAHFSDWPTIAALLCRQGQDMAQAGPEARRLVQFDPRRCYVLCACALINSAERLVAVGVIDLASGESSEPDLMILEPEVAEIAGPETGEALTGLLRGALVGAARSAARGRAA